MINNIIDKIKTSKKIGITCHTSPDGDSIGSSLALMQGISTLGKEVYIMSKEVLPTSFEYLPFSNDIDKQIQYVLDGTDIVIVVDCGNVERINANLDINDREYTLINIDHHLSNDLYGDLNYVDPKSAAVAEIIYQLLKKMQVPITKDIAACLYTSLITDTGSFRHSNTTNLTHQIAGELIQTGIKFSDIHRNIFEDIKFQRVKLQGAVIENMYLELNRKICIMEITENMLNLFNIEKGDTSDIINIGTQIDTVEVSILFKEAEEGFKVSLRSKNLVDVSKIAGFFGGGGHIRASGFFSSKSLEEIKNILINEIEKELI